jgi:hypothetical protein
MELPTVIDEKKTARIAGLWYLGLAITGMLGFLLVRPAIHIPGDAAATAQNVMDREALARLGVTLELGIVLSQVLAAVWFFKLFRGINTVAAGSLAAFGFVNAIAILGSAACMSTAIAVAGDASLAPGGDAAATIQLFYVSSSKLWGVGALFFGLWLIPMGHLAVTSGRMPKALGWVLMGGGVGYMLSAFLSNGVVGAPTWLVDGLTVPATIGEFWMIGYLLSVGIRPIPDHKPPQPGSPG